MNASALTEKYVGVFSVFVVLGVFAVSIFPDLFVERKEKTINQQKQTKNNQTTRSKQETI